MTLTEYIATLGATDWSVSKGSLTEGQLTVRYHVQNGEENPHTEGVGTEITGAGWHYRLTSVTESENPDGGGHEVTQVWTDSKGVLDKIPCFVKQNLPLETRQRIADGLRWGNAVLVSAQELLTAAQNAAERAGYSISFGSVNGECMIPWTDSNQTIGQVIEYVARWVPNLTTRTSGRELEVTGGYVRLDTGTAATASVACTPNMKRGTLRVGSTVVDLAAVYAENAASVEPLNWYAHHAGLIADRLAYCAEASVMAVGNTLYLTARERGAAGNDIALTLTGVSGEDTAARARLTLPADLAQAGSLTDGENSVELEAVEGTAASGWIRFTGAPLADIGLYIGGVHVATDHDSATPAEWAAAISAADCGVDAEVDGTDTVKINLTARAGGTAGNAITIGATDWTTRSGETLEGGTDGARTVEDLVEAVNGNTHTDAALRFTPVWNVFGELHFTLNDGDVILVESVYIRGGSGVVWGDVENYAAVLRAQLGEYADVSAVDGDIVMTAKGIYGESAGNALRAVASWSTYKPWNGADTLEFTGGVDEHPIFPDFHASAAGGTAASGSGEISTITALYAMVTVMQDGVELAHANLMLPPLYRTAAGLATRINANAALSAVIEATGSGDVLSITAKESGSGMNGAKVLIQASATTDTITLKGGEDGDIVLTAKVAGSTGNDLNARAEGCFGSAGAFSGGTDASEKAAEVTPFHGGEDGDEPAPYDGLLGQRPSGATVPTWPVTNWTRETSEGEQPCSCVIGMRRGGVMFKFPADANPYSVGALIIDVPDTPHGEWSQTEDLRETAAIKRIVQQANREREKTQPWNYVRGNPVPKGWKTATPGMKMTVEVGNPEAWKAFWSQFGDFDTLKRINGVTGIAFGTPAFFPVPADDAYPPDPEGEDKGIGGGTLGPAIKENGNAPANYRVLTPRDNMHLLVSGSFPASTHSSGNVGGLRFCHGTLKQYVWTTGGATGITEQEGMEFFEGTCKVGGRMRRYVCLSVKAVWINRRKKRWQNGTNRLAPSDPDYDADKDGGTGWYRLGEEEGEEAPHMTTADYVEAAREYWESSRNCGGGGGSESIHLHAVQNFNADLSVDDVFAKLGLSAANGSITYSAGTHTLEVNSSASQRDALGFEDYLLRIQARKQAELLEWRERNQERETPTPRDPEDPTPPPTPQQVDETNEKQSYPMVNSGGISTSHGVTGNGQPIDPFEVYAEDNRWYINEGTIPHEPPINFPTTEITAIHAPNRAYFVKPYYDRATHTWKGKACWRART